MPMHIKMYHGSIINNYDVIIRPFSMGAMMMMLHDHFLHLHLKHLCPLCCPKTPRLGGGWRAGD